MKRSGKSRPDRGAPWAPGDCLTRRELLMRAGVAVCAYVAPQVIQISEAHASSGSGGGGNSGSGGGGSGSSSGGSDNSGSGSTSSGSGEDKDDDAARQAVSRGQAAPLSDILANVRQRYQGEVASVRLKQSGEKLYYMVRVIDDQDRIIDVRLDAKTGLIIGTGGLN